MSIYFYQLKFETPVHFGMADAGGKLEQVGYTFPSDELYNALCCELAQQKPEWLLSNFINKLKQGEIVCSDLFPFVAIKDSLQLFLPKPIILVNPEKKADLSDLQAVRKQATVRKKQKKMEYIRAGNIAQYLYSLRYKTGFTEKNEFGMFSLTEKVNCRNEEPLPYYVGTFNFYQNAGLYLLVYFQHDDDECFFSRLMQSLGLTGIGGKRSSGYGKYYLAYHDRLSALTENDADQLRQMLADNNRDWQMNLSSIIPDDTDIPVLKRSWYQLKKTGSFVTPLPNETEQKISSIYVLKSGSCFRRRLTGKVAVLGKSNGHDVLRFGKGLYMGLKL